MNSPEANNRYVDKSEESSWTWPRKKLSEKEIHMMMAILLEISVNIFFQSFVYTFGGECFIQTDGGPIGARLTMCVARLVLQDWYDKFRVILEESGIKEHLRGLYVDDGRKVTDILALGTRFNEKEGKFESNEDFLKEDVESCITRKDLTEREVRKAMNSINKDLTFTTETEMDFENKRLPTLSFQMWSEKSGLRYSYFEKEMRSQILTMSRSSQSEKSKISILVNELNRRLYMIDKDVEEEERIEIVDHFTTQLLRSGYNINQILEIVQSSLLGMMKKEEIIMKRGENASEEL